MDSTSHCTWPNFLVYINDSQNYLNKGFVPIITYAEDTNLLIYEKRFEKLLLEASVIYRKRKDWFQGNFLILNTE